MNQLKIQNLFSLQNTVAREIFEGKTFPWEILPQLKSFILELGKSLPEEEFETRGDGIWIHKTAKVFPSAYITGPAIIDKDAEIRHCAFIRGGVIVGKGAVVGNSTELKNSLLFDKVQVPHYNYIGDSVLGFMAHLGAGAVTSNVKSDKTNVTVNFCGQKIPTALRKFGAAVGDNVEVGCGSVLNPGSVIGKNSNLYPLSMVRGYVPENSIYKNRNEIVAKN